MMANDTLPIPWYRQFWPWFLIALPATAVIAGIATLIIAMHEPDGLVEDDYYKAGLAINQELGRDREATRLGVSALVRRDPEQGWLTVELMSREPLNLASLRLRLLHATRENFDRELELLREADGLFRARLGGVPAGEWNLQLQPVDSSWRLTGRMSLLELGQTRLIARD
jgi:hypothetical protein